MTSRRQTPPFFWWLFVLIGLVQMEQWGVNQSDTSGILRWPFFGLGVLILLTAVWNVVQQRRAKR